MSTYNATIAINDHDDCMYMVSHWCGPTHVLYSLERWMNNDAAGKEHLEELFEGVDAYSTIDVKVNHHESYNEWAYDHSVTVPEWFELSVKKYNRGQNNGQPDAKRC